jgi:cytidine deaminase
MNELIRLMINHAKQALVKAYAPYSNYQVSSCLCGEDGNLYTGVNVENSSYGLTICAESSAICQMVASGQQKIKSLVVLNSKNTICSPCGACRQRIAEFATADTTIHLCTDHNIIQSISIDELLPYPFRLNLEQK